MRKSESRRRAWRGVDVLRALTLCAIVATTALAGCAGTEPADAVARRDAGAIRFPTMTIKPTPAEPFEIPGNSVLAWQGDTFGIQSNDPKSGLRRMSIVADGYAYNTNLAIGWYKVEYPGDLSAGHHASPLYAVWDFPRLVEDPALQVSVRENGESQNFTFVGALPRGGRTYVVHLELGVRDGEAVWGRLDAEDIPESPFTFWKGGELTFALTPPTDAKLIEEVIPKETAALEGHKTIIQLLKDYSNRRGSVPDEVTPQTLQLELIASGATWPSNAFDGSPLRSVKDSGHFVWVKCTEKSGSYTGYGWDSPLQSQDFTKRCPP